jgi:hypothetical protein
MRMEGNYRDNLIFAASPAEHDIQNLHCSWMERKHSQIIAHYQTIKQHKNIIDKYLAFLTQNRVVFTIIETIR